MGAWMKVNTEAIYATKASPFGTLSWGRCTQKDQKGNTVLYFSVFNWPKDGKLVIAGLNQSVKSAQLLAGKISLKTIQSSGGLEITVPEKAPDAIASVIKVIVEGKID